jgi:hypothetical protein
VPAKGGDAEEESSVKEKNDKGQVWSANQQQQQTTTNN